MEGALCNTELQCELIHTEWQMVFSAEDVSMEIQALAGWNLLGGMEALYLGIKPVSILLKESFEVSV